MNNKEFRGEIWCQSQSSASFGVDDDVEVIAVNELFQLIDQLDYAEPHLYNIAGHMTDYHNCRISKHTLVELIEKELDDYYSKEVSE